MEASGRGDGSGTRPRVNHARHIATIRPRWGVAVAPTGDGTMAATDEPGRSERGPVDLTWPCSLSGLVFAVLAVAGNALQGSTPALHGEADAVADFYNDKATAIAFGMMLSLISVFFLAWFLAALRRHLRLSEGVDGWITPTGLGWRCSDARVAGSRVRPQLGWRPASARERHLVRCCCRLLRQQPRADWLGRQRCDGGPPCGHGRTFHIAPARGIAGRLLRGHVLHLVAGARR